MRHQTELHDGVAPLLSSQLSKPSMLLPAQETRSQMMNDVKALCDAPNVPGLIEFHGAYHVPDSGQVT